MPLQRDDMAPFAEMLDTAYGGSRYTNTMASLRQRIDHGEDLLV